MYSSYFNRASGKRPLSQIFSVAFGLVLTFAAMFLLAATSRAEETPTTTHDVTTMETIGPRPTVVLVPGAWLNASGWNAVASRLRRNGLRVVVHRVPLRGLSSDAAELSKYLRTIKGPLVLVGHSYGGAVITNIHATPGVKALVYVNAFAPDKGESVLELAAARPGSIIAGDTAHAFDTRAYPGATHGDTDLYVKDRVFMRAFANGLPPKRAVALAATQPPLSLSALTERSGIPAWRTIPSWALIGTTDRVVPPAEQLFMAKRAHSNVTRLKAGSLALISNPDAVTDLILAAAASVRAEPTRCDPLTSCTEPPAPPTTISNNAP
jgi:pimeloyl-ACP methyl ester carboxylesterase